MNVRQVRFGIDLFTGLVVASVGVALAGLTWRLAGYSGVPPVAAVTPNPTANPVDINGLLALAPFGTPAAASDAASDGSLHLKGILRAVPESASSALIAGADGKVTSYGIGEALGGGLLEAISDDHVILRTPRGLQTLGFSPVAGSAPPAAVGANTKSTGFVPVATAASILAQSGFRIGSAVPATLLAAGLQPGDVVEEVNKTPVTAGMSADMIGRMLAGAALHGSPVQAIVLRNGTRISLRLAIH